MMRLSWLGDYPNIVALIIAMVILGIIITWF